MALVHKVMQKQDFGAQVPGGTFLGATGLIAECRTLRSLGAKLQTHERIDRLADSGEVPAGTNPEMASEVLRAYFMEGMRWGRDPVDAPEESDDSICDRRPIHQN